MSSSEQLHKSLGPFMLWGLGVGYVISGMYFGWNLGLPVAGPYGMAVATFFVTIMYLCFVLSYAELSCALPRAGGAFVYADRALGPAWGFLAGAAQIIEFVFAPPAIAFAIGAYMSQWNVGWDPLITSFAAYILFTALNIWGVRASAIFELCITVIAVLELLIFAGVAGSGFSWQAFHHNPLPQGWMGTFAAIPFAIWFYLAIEGLANVAEESRNPQKDIASGFISSIITLIILAVLTFFTSIGVAGWEAIVYPQGSTQPSDSPLPLALGIVVGRESFFFELLLTIGLFGLIASFHGIILIAGRATLEFGRVGYAPAFLGKISASRKTPANALIVNMLIGCIALVTGKTAEIITLAVFGALTLYAISIVALFRLRQKEPELHRPYHSPLYPYLPMTALVLSVICLISMFIYNLQIGLAYLLLMFLGFLYYRWVGPRSIHSTPSIGVKT